MLTFVGRVEEFFTILSSLGSELLDRLDVNLVEDLAERGESRQ